MQTLPSTLNRLNPKLVAALERALGPENTGEQAGETCVTLAREWLALADRPSDTEPRSASRAAG